MSFHVYGSGPVVLSIPAWTPGSYELDNFARFISDFSAESSGQPIRWDKADFDSWRVHPDGAGRVTVRFRYHADTLDTGMAGAKDDFAFFNGTTVFPYPEGQSFDFPARVSVVTEPDWLVATGMRGAGSPGEYEAATYHELVDMPFFVGRFDLDSTRVDDRWYRLATYPSGTVTGEDRERLWEDIEAMIPPMAAVFGETPWVDYTILALFEEGFPGGAALEHRNSHLGIYAPQLVPSPILPLVMAHETFHAWNVKRLRPEELWPYEYDRAQPTTLLWVSEGVTDYYADLALVRGGIVDPDLFYQLLTLKIRQTEAAGPVSLEDASVSTWIEPDDGTATIYYQKGSLAGLFLDILIRDATDNRTSLDQVMRMVGRRQPGCRRSFVRGIPGPLHRGPGSVSVERGPAARRDAGDGDVRPSSVHRRGDRGGRGRTQGDRGHPGQPGGGVRYHAGRRPGPGGRCPSRRLRLRERVPAPVRGRTGGDDGRSRGPAGRRGGEPGNGDRVHGERDPVGRGRPGGGTESARHPRGNLRRPGGRLSRERR
jgi:predicted metalloprotease with PDZ domain